MSEACQRPESTIQKDSGRLAQRVISQEGGSLSERSTSKIWLLAGLLVVVCAVVSAAHWPALSAQALSFDDNQYLTENSFVQNPSWASARRFLTEVVKPSTVKGYYHPLSMLSLMADCALGGREDNLRPFHRTSLALHVANTALVIVLLYMLFGRVWIAAGVGLLFGLHPMTVETIPWVGERKTLLAAFFAFWSLILYVRYAGKRNWRVYIGCLVMYVLALMSKPTSIPLPVLVLLMDYWPLQRLSKKTILEKLPLFIVGGIFAIVTCVSEIRSTAGSTAGVVLPSAYGLQRVLLTLCHNIVFYLYKIIWPVNLSSYYAYPEPLGLSDPMVLAGVIGTCILIGLLVISLRWTRVPLTGLLFFFVAIFPTLGVVGFTFGIAGDKFAYLPSVGLLMVLASLLSWFCGAGKPVVRQAAVVVVVLVLAGTEAVATRRYLVHWRDTVSLYKHMLTITPDAAPVHNNLGNALQSEGKLEEAISHYREVIRTTPDFPKVHNNLGVVLATLGQFDGALKYFREAVCLKPDYVAPLNSMAWILATHPAPKLRDAAQATEFAERAAELTGYQNATVLDTLAAAYAAAGRFDKAVSSAQAALDLAYAVKDDGLANEIRNRLELYKQRKPYR